MNLHIQRDGQQYGHYSLEEARALLAEGKLLPGDLARPDGATDWKLLSTLPGFSTPPALPANAAKRRRRMPLPISIGLCLLGLLVVTFLIWRIHLASQINARLAAIKAAGFPNNATEHDAWYEAVPEKENAALIVMQAIEQLKPNDPRQEEIAFRGVSHPLPRSTSLPISVRAYYSQRVEANHTALTLLHKAPSLSKSRYPIDCTLGYRTPLPHLAGLKSSAKLLHAEAMLFAESNNAAAATESIQAELALARSLKSEPILISQIVRIEVEKFAFDTLEGCISRITFTDSQLAALSSLFRQSDVATNMKRAMAGERAMFVENYRVSAQIQNTSTASDDSEEESANIPQFQKNLSLMRWNGLFERDLGFWLSSMETNIIVAGWPAPESLTLSRLVDAQTIEAKQKYYIMSGLLLPALGRGTIKAAKGSAYLRTAEAVLAIERFRLAHQNTLPDSLAALTPAYLETIPTDPFDGQPLRYKRLEKGYLVYSVGDDLKDDGGVSPNNNASRRRMGLYTTDITFTVER